MKRALASSAKETESHEMVPEKKSKFGKANPMAKAKSSSKKKGAAADFKIPSPMFKNYNLVELTLPSEAWPCKNKIYHGKHGYTLNAKSGAAARRTIRVCVVASVLHAVRS